MHNLDVHPRTVLSWFFFTDFKNQTFHTAHYKDTHFIIIHLSSCAQDVEYFIYDKRDILWRGEARNLLKAMGICDYYRQVHLEEGF